MPAQNELLTCDYFRLFGYSESTAIDAADLSARYLKLQQQFHPDRFAGQPDYERRLALTMASRINDAYTTLKKPLARAIYRLSLHGFEALAEDNTAMPPDFLEKQIQWRETLAEQADDAPAMTALAKTVGEEREQTAAQTETLLQSENYADACALVRQWVYLDKLWQSLPQQKQ